MPKLWFCTVITSRKCPKSPLHGSFADLKRARKSEIATHEVIRYQRQSMRFKFRCMSFGIAAITPTILLLALCSMPEGRVEAAQHPNILFILADDHRPDALGALGNTVVKTPNLDSLVQRGTSFSHCYVMGSMSGAVRQPSRTMMLTGRSWLRIPKPKEDITNSLPKLLKAAGYDTFHVGKGGNEYDAGLEAFDTNIVINALRR